MAGYMAVSGQDDGYRFSLQDDNLIAKLSQANQSRLVMTLQLSGDELAAALWGFKNYQQGVAGYLIIHSDRPHVRLLDKSKLDAALRGMQPTISEDLAIHEPKENDNV